MYKKYRNEKGQSMVEFALILPLLLIIIGGIIDFGWLFYNQAELNDSARDAARYGTVHTAPADRVALITTRVNSVAPASIKPVTINVTYSNTSSPVSGDVTVTLSSTIPILTPILGVFVKGQTKVLTSSVTMKAES